MSVIHNKLWVDIAESLKKQHPDLVEVVWKFNRWHHLVNYKGFRQTPILKEGVTLGTGINNYGMVLKEF